VVARRVSVSGAAGWVGLVRVIGFAMSPEGGGTAAPKRCPPPLLVAPEDVGVDGARTGHVSV